jgi:hypothetical protein
METSPFFFAGEDYQQQRRLDNIDGEAPLLPGEEQLRKRTPASFTRLLRQKASIIKSTSRTSLRRITSKTGHPTSSPTSVADTLSFDTDASTPTSIFLIQPSPDVPYLQPELFARIATFVPADQVGNLLVAAAPHSRNVATMIRTTYLKTNYAYLAYSWILPYAKRQRNVSEWMKVNDDWRNLYNDPQATESGVFGLMFNNLLRATELGNVDIIRHLVEQRGADVNQEEQRADVEQRSLVRPIMIAFKLPDSEVLQYYLQEAKGLDLNYLVYPESGLRFLHQVVSLRHASRVDHLELLLQKKDAIDINARVNNGMTALHLFAGRKSMPRDAVVRLRCLLEAGADPSLRDNNFLTPLLIFKQRKDGKMLDKPTRTRIKALLAEDFY